MFQKHAQIIIILLVLVFSGTNFATGIRFDPVAEEVSQPAGESSSDMEADKKMNDDQDRSSSFSVASCYCLNKSKSGIHYVILQSDHTLEVISPPPESFCG